MNGLLQNITQALGWSIAHSLWQGALIYGMLCFLYLFLPKLTAKNKYAFALFGQFILSIAFVITFGHYMDISSTSEEVFMDYVAAPLVLSSETSSSFLKAVNPLLPWMSSLYVLGLSFQFIIFSSSLSKLRYLKTRGLSTIPIVWDQSFRDICFKLQIKQHIQFHLSEKISVPMVIGHLKPIILFPVAFVNHLELEQVESILIHELAHIKRQDYLFNLFKVAMETILFFNPFVWLLSRYIDTEREHACDDIVMKWTPSSIAYAQALMSVECLKSTAAPMYAMAAIGKKHHLLHRIQRITNMEKNHLHARQHLIAVVLCSLALLTIAWISPSEKPATVTEEINMTPAVEDPTAIYQIPPAAAAPDYPSFLQDTITPPLSPEEPRTEETYIKDVEAEAKKIEAYYNSPEWKNKIADIEKQARKTEEYFTSSEWKAQIAEIEAEAKKIEAYYNSPAWKNKVAEIETQAAKKTEEYFNSSEWKSKLADIEENTKKIEAYYNSPEWKNKIADIETQAKKVGEYFNSTEWKEKIADIEASAKNMAEHYNSLQ
ncbi:M56 family metallopeptidase [Sphingobacterium corticibacterium]|uniref:Peptidase M56 domain-containing protein n=1 Tax=Sphingobacterium corticibacterium TaxID=2484746 RepID=A0A4Q6XUV6_9SPHI|nr:M56 family metallopeptidase [Sphingobacterium corticibacterium]RZF60417.1 hypothetical protein EWE74_15070 [Sphingobacterium corticibacterium]